MVYVRDASRKGEEVLNLSTTKTEDLRDLLSDHDSRSNIYLHNDIMSWLDGLRPLFVGGAVTERGSGEPFLLP